MTNIEKFNPFDDAMQFANNPADFIQDKSTDIAKGKLCEVIGEFPMIGPAICEEKVEDPAEESDNEESDNEESDILKGTPLEEPNNKLKEQLVGTPLENIGIEPIFLIAGTGIFLFIIIIVIVIIIGLGLFYYFNFYESNIEDTLPLLKQYEFPIPPPPPPPPVNFVMDSNIAS
jgi:hypothetical protein